MENSSIRLAIAEDPESFVDLGYFPSFVTVNSYGLWRKPTSCNTEFSETCRKYWQYVIGNNHCDSGEYLDLLVNLGIPG